MSNLTTSIQLTKSSTYKLNNGYHIPVAGFGVYLVAQSECADLVYQALLDGYRHIDTAIMYKNEEEVAEGIAKFLKDHPDVSREDIFFTTKINTDNQGYEETKAAVAETAKKVKKYIDYVDLFLIHAPITNPEKRIGTYKALQEFVLNPTNGVLNIKSIGVSNYGIAHLQELLDWEGLIVKPVVNQLELHPWLPRLELREFMAKHDILPEAYSPLTRGRKFQDPELLQLQHTYRISAPEMLLKWSYLQGFIVLVKTATKSRIKENLDILPDDSTSNDPLDTDAHFGKIDLDINILNALDKPESEECLIWGGKDVTKHTP